MEKLRLTQNIYIILSLEGKEVNLKSAFPHGSVKKSSKDRVCGGNYMHMIIPLAYIMMNTTSRHTDPSCGASEETGFGNTADYRRKDLCTVRFTCFPLPS